MRYLQCVALAFASAAIASASDVASLTKETFPDFIKENDLALLEFFAPWCGHCKALAPEYEEAATTLKEKKIALAKVDCTEEADLCQSFGVEGYPTLKVFRGAENVSPYSGARKAPAIVSYMTKQSLPAVSVLTKDTLEDFKTADKVVLVAYFDAEDKTSNTTFNTVAEKLRDDYLFGASNDAALAKAEGVSFPSIVLYKSFDEGKAIYPDAFDAEVIEKFAKTASIPLIGEVGPETYAGYMATGIPLAYIFAETPEERTTLAETLKPVAEKHRGAISFATIDAKAFGAHAGNLNLDADKFPAFAIQSTVDNKKYPFDQSVEITEASISKFVQQYVDGKVEPSIKSEPIPEKQEGPVQIVVAHNYDDIVLDDKKDVLIEFYAPWCGHCKALAPKLKPTRKKSMGDYRLLRNSGVVIGIILLHLFTFASLVSSDELQFVVGESGELQVTPSLEVKGSPGLKPDRTSLCERIHIHGLGRFKHLDKYAHSLKLIVNASISGKTNNIDVCFHRNLSRGIGMCPHSRWEKASKGSWVQTMSPFDHKILDVRVPSSNKVSLEVSAVEELFMHRIVFLLLGAVLLASASTLSQSLAFYYSSAMAVGIILVVLLVLFQGMKLLPTGRSSFALFIYSTLLGLGGFLLRYLPGLFESLLTEMGIDEEMYTPAAIFVGAFLSLGGAFFGFWTVRKLILTEDGSIDVSTSLFVSWSIRIMAAVLILQSSVDPLLAGGALISVILMSSTLKKITRLKFLLRLFEIPLNLLLGIWEAIRDTDIPSVPGYLHDFMQKSPDASGFRNRVTSASPSGGINNGMRESPPSESDTFPSSFHKTPERSQLTKEEWKKLTKDSTTKAVQELVSSPDFGKWAAVNADRINVTPRKGSSSKNQPRKWMRWF